MLTFAQFITEWNSCNDYGFLRPGQRPITKQAKDRGRWNHLGIAKKHGFTNHREAIKKAGWVRYDHQNDTKFIDPGTTYAGYEFRHDPESKKMVADHLKKTGPFNKIVFDVHHNGQIQSHEFHNTGEALRHLGESFLAEGPDYYRHFGWIKPDGSYIDGDKFPKAKNHQDILPKKMKGTSSQDYRKPFAAGWVRHGQMKYDNSHIFHAGRINHSNINTIDNFMLTKKHHDMGGDKYRLMADEPSYREINGHSKEHFINVLHN